MNKMMQKFKYYIFGLLCILLIICSSIPTLVFARGDSGGLNGAEIDDPFVYVPSGLKSRYPDAFYTAGDDFLVRAFIVDLDTVPLVEGLDGDTPTPASYCAGLLSSTDNRTKVIYGTTGSDNTSAIDRIFTGNGSGKIYVQNNGSWTSIIDNSSMKYVGSSFMSTLGLNGSALGGSTVGLGGAYDVATDTPEELGAMIDGVFGGNSANFNLENSVLVIEPLLSMVVYEYQITGDDANGYKLVENPRFNMLDGEASGIKTFTVDGMEEVQLRYKSYAFSFQEWIQICSGGGRGTNLVPGYGFSVLVRGAVDWMGSLKQAVFHGEDISSRMIPFVATGNGYADWSGGDNTGYALYGPPVGEQPQVEKLGFNTLVQFNGNPGETSGNFSVYSSLNKTDEEAPIGVVYWDKNENEWREGSSIEQTYNFAGINLENYGVVMAEANSLDFAPYNVSVWSAPTYTRMCNVLDSCFNPSSYTVTWGMKQASDLGFIVDEDYGYAYTVTSFNGDVNSLFSVTEELSSGLQGIALSNNPHSSSIKLEQIKDGADEAIPSIVHSAYKKASNFFESLDISTSMRKVTLGHSVELIAKANTVQSTLHVIDCETGGVSSSTISYKTSGFGTFTLPSDACAYMVTTNPNAPDVGSLASSLVGQFDQSAIYGILIGSASNIEEASTDVPGVIGVGTKNNDGFTIICVVPTTPPPVTPTANPLELVDFKLNHVYDNVISLTASMNSYPNYYWMLNSNRYTKTTAITSYCTIPSSCTYPAYCHSETFTWISDYNKDYNVKYKDESTGMVIGYDSGALLGKYLLRGSGAWGSFIRREMTKDYVVTMNTENLVSEAYHLDYAFNLVRACVDDVRTVSSLTHACNIDTVLRTQYGDKPLTVKPATSKRDSYAYINNASGFSSVETIAVNSKFVVTDEHFGFYICKNVPAFGTCNIDDAADGGSGPHGLSSHSFQHTYDCGTYCQHNIDNHELWYHSYNCVFDGYCDGCECPGHSGEHDSGTCEPGCTIDHGEIEYGLTCSICGYGSQCQGHGSVGHDYGCPDDCTDSHTYYDSCDSYCPGHYSACQGHRSDTHVAACDCPGTHTMTHTCNLTTLYGGHIIAGYHKWATDGYKTSYGHVNTYQDWVFYTKVYKYLTDEIPGQTHGENTKITGSDGLGITVGAKKVTAGSVTVENGYRYAYALKHDGSNNTTNMLLKFYPEVKMAYTTQSGESYNDAEANTWHMVYTMGEKLRKVQPSSLYLYRLRGTGNELTGMTYSDSMQGGSSILGNATKPIIPAGSDVSLVAKPTGITMDLYGYALDLVNKSTDGGNMAGSNISYSSVIVSGVDVYQDWGNAGSTTALFNDFKKWHQKMTNVENYESDVMLKVTGSGNKVYNNFGSVISQITPVTPTQDGVYPIAVRKGVICKGELGYQALITQIAADYVAEDPDNITSADKAMAESIFEASGLYTAIIEAVEDCNDSFNTSRQPKDFGYTFPLGNSTHWYDEEVKTFVVRRYVSEGNKFGDIVLEDKIDYGAAADHNSSSAKPQSYNNGDWYVSIYLRNSINTITPKYEPANKAGTASVSTNNYSLLIHEVLVHGADFSIPSSSTSDFGY